MAERVTLPTDVIPSHYALELTPDLEQLSFTCDEKIKVTVQKEQVTEVTLHSKEIYILSASFANGPAVTEINYNVKTTTVKFVFEGPLPVGEGEIAIKYRGILNGDMAGFYKSMYSDANGNKKVMASTQFEALDARRAFPCWDEPSMKATFSVTLVVPSHLTALSNMPEVSCMHIPAPVSPGAAAAGSATSQQMLKKVVFDTSPKMSTYLLAWAVGEFDFVRGKTEGGVEIRVYSPPGRALQGNFALGVAIKSLDFYDRFFKTPYPLPKLDMLCVTEFAMGAMENWGLVTYREVDLMIDEAKASSQSKQRVAIVVAHELAHQWFGNLVTMAWWDGLWLNEGFAAYMEHFAVDYVFPDYKIWEQYTTDAFSAAQRLDALKSSHPVIVPIKHAEEVEQVFDAISYCKGSTVVNMVAAILGPQKFQEGLAAYMKRHQYGNTETLDLWTAWSEASGKNVAQLMKTWTTVMGYPYLQVLEEKWSETEVEITLKQERFLSDGSSAADATEDKDVLWSIPLLFATAGSVSQTAVIMDQKVQTFKIPVSGGDNNETRSWLKINAGQKALVRVAHSAEMILRLKEALMADRNAVAPVDRAALLLDSYALAKAGLAPLETVLEIVRALEDEESSIVWNALSGVLNGLYLLLEQLPNGKDTFESFVAFGKKFVVKALAKVGWDSKGDAESHTDKLLRATVLGLLDSFAWNDAGVAAEARRRFDAHWEEDPTALPAEYKTTVYRIVLLNGGITEYNTILEKSFVATQDNSVRKYAMNSLGATADKTLKLRTLDWAVKSGDVKLQDFFYPVGSVASSLDGAELAWKYFQENFDLIKEKLSKASPSLMDAIIVYSINRFCTTSKADEIAAFFDAHPLPSSQRRISQALENMRTSAKMLSAISTSPLASASFWETTP